MTCIAHNRIKTKFRLPIYLQPVTFGAQFVPKKSNFRVLSIPLVVGLLLPWHGYTLVMTHFLEPPANRIIRPQSLGLGYYYAIPISTANCRDTHNYKYTSNLRYLVNTMHNNMTTTWAHSNCTHSKHMQLQLI